MRLIRTLAVAIFVTAVLVACGGDVDESELSARDSRVEPTTTTVEPTTTTTLEIVPFDLDIGTDSVTEIVDVGEGPAALATSESAVWLVDNFADLTNIDPGSYQHSIASEYVSGEPDHLAATSTSLWVTEVDGNVVQRFDPRIDAFESQLLATIPVDMSTTGLAATETAVWVTGEDAVSRIDPATNEVVATIPVADGTNLGVAATDLAVWTLGVTRADGVSTSVLSRIDPETNEVVASVSTDWQALGMAATDAGVWMTALDGDDTDDAELADRLFRIDPATNEIAVTTAIENARGVAATDEAVWVTRTGVFGEGNVVRIDPRSDEVVTGIPIPLNAGGEWEPGWIAARGSSVWITSPEGECVYRVDA